MTLFFRRCGWMGGRRLAFLLIVFVVLLANTGCNTMRGVGKDIEKAGEAIQKSVK